MVQLPKVPSDMQRLFPDRMHSEVDTEQRQAGRAAVLAIYSAQALLMSFALKLKVSSAMRSTGPGLPQTRASPNNVSWRSLCGPAGFSILFSGIVPPQVFVEAIVVVQSNQAIKFQSGNISSVLNPEKCLAVSFHCSMD